MKFLSSIIISLFLAIVIHGCVDENIIPNSESVNVHLFDDYLFGFDQGKVSINNFPMAIPNGSGNICLKNILTPFTFKLTYVTLEVPSVSEIYEYTNCKDVNLIVENVWGPGYQTDLEININYPNLQDKQIGIIKFISKYPFYEDYCCYIYPGENQAQYGLYFPSSKNEIQGKFVILIFTTGHGYLSYDNYGEKDVTLNRNPVQYVSIDSTDILFNPPEKEISYLANIPDKCQGYSTDFYISFDGYVPESDLPLANLHYQGNILVPTALISGFKIKLLSYVNFGGYNYSYKWIETSPGNDIFLDNSTHPENFTPPDNSTNISDTSIFSFDDNFNTGIYYIRFAQIYYDQSYVTHNKKISLGELKKAGLNFAPGTLYSWYVERYTNFSSMDDFLSQPYLLNPNYNSKIVSERRIFRTAP